MSARNKLPLIGFLAMLAITCSTAAWAQSVYVNYYTPQFYMDNLVFYDETGAPIYYEGDLAYAVPSDHPEYDGMANHFLDNEDAYFRWFEDVGYENLEFRRSPVLDYYRPRYHHGYLVFYVAGQPVYYIDGIKHVISPSDRRYARLVRHFSKHKPDYRRWYRSVGRHYRYYRRPVFTDYYRPMYFNGYLVFFDASGHPYYYRDNHRVFVPRHHHRYRNYISHYRTHRHNYTKWYGAKGRKHHDYRRPKHYRKRTIAPKAPKSNRGKADRRRYRNRIRKPTIHPKHDHKPRIEPKRHGHRDRPDRRDRHDHIDKPKRPDRHDRPDRKDKRKPPKPRADKKKPGKKDKHKGKDKRKMKPPRSRR